MRGYAAMAVVIFHLAAIYTPIPASPLRDTVFSFSNAVPLFFALSAFSLLYGYSSRIFDTESLERFYVRRVFRIVPLFYFMLIIYIIRQNMTGESPSNSEILLNLTFLFPFLPGKHESIVWAGWSLGVEWLFYMVFPVFALLARRLFLSTIVLLLFVLVALAFARIYWELQLDPSYKLMGMPRALMFFQAGVLAYSLSQQPGFRKWLSQVAPKATSVTLWILLVTTTILFINRFADAGGPLVISDILFAPICGIWILCGYAGLSTFIDNRASRFLGRISYGIYLIHPMVLWALSELGIYGAISRAAADPYGAYLISALISIPTVLIIASLAYRAIEAPGIALGESVLRRRSNHGHPPMK